MDRRDFLKLMGLSAAGLYVPTRSYFFMPQTQLKTIEVPVYGGPTRALYLSAEMVDGLLNPLQYNSVTVNMLVETKTQIIKSYEVPPQLVGNVTKGQLERAIDRMMYQKGMNLSENT